MLSLVRPADHAVKEIKLPLRHEDIIRQQAADKEVDPSLIAGVIYTESHFRDLTSHAGAKGLMQLMPETADYIARKSGGTPFERADLATPQINISYGTWYLRYLLDKYDGNTILRSPPTTRGRARSTSGVPPPRPRASASRSPATSRSRRRATTSSRVLNARANYRRSTRSELGSGTRS